MFKHYEAINDAERVVKSSRRQMDRNAESLVEEFKTRWGGHTTRLHAPQWGETGINDLILNNDHDIREDNQKWTDRYTVLDQILSERLGPQPTLRG